MRAWAFSLLVLIQVPCLPVRGQTVSGSGFVIHTDGFVLTNHHVVASADQINVVVPGKGAFQASIVGDDEYKDLAVLKVGATGLESLPITESKNVKILDTIVVLGYPLASTLGADVSASEGQVNALREEGRIPLLQIDANVNPGNSGPSHHLEVGESFRGQDFPRTRTTSELRISGLVSLAKMNR